MKNYILTPSLLVIYLGFMAYHFHPAKNPELSYTKYYVTIGVTLVFIAASAFFLKKKADRKKRVKSEE
jgi:uncharacterized membrane protein